MKARGSRVGLRVGWRVWLLSALLAVSGCTCTTCAPSAEAERTVGAHRIRIDGQAAHKWDVDGFGIPHVGGLIWPTVEGAGYTIRVVVDERPPVTVAVESAMPSKEQLEARVAAVEVVASPDDHHLGVRVETTATWRVLHLLPRGVPFDAPGSEVKDPIDWSAFADPASIASSEIRDTRCHADKSCPLVWSAVAAQDAKGPLDDVALEVWPKALAADQAVLRLAQPASGATLAWRRAAGEKGLAALQVEETRERGFQLVVTLADPASSSRMDRLLIDDWKTHGGDDRLRSYELLERRLKPGPSAPMAPAERAHAAQTARALVVVPERTHWAAEVLVLAGTAEDVGWMDGTLVEMWPLNDQRCALCDGVHEVVTKRFQREGWGPPPSPAVRERATERGLARLTDAPMRDKAVLLVVAAGTDRGIAAVLDDWLATWPDDTGNDHVVKPVRHRGSSEWKARAAAKAGAWIDEAWAKYPPGDRNPSARMSDDEVRKTRASIQVLVELEGERLPCARWERIAILGRGIPSIGDDADLPARCQPKKK